MKDIVNSSSKWFNKEITHNELIEMYNKNFCQQTKTISVIFTNTKYPIMVYNNNNIETVDNVINILREENHFKKCIINVEIEYHGIYFYADNTKNKWIVSSIDITDISNDNNNEWINRDDIVDKLSDNIGLINNKMNKRIIELQQYINELEENKLNINKLFLELKVSPCNNIQDPLNKINQLIIYQESKINNI
jgi:Zn-finger protein